MLRRKNNPLPVLSGWDDSVVMFRSKVLLDETDGVTLMSALDRLVQRHNPFARAVVSMGSLGSLSYERALDALRTYERTGVAVMPTPL
jgi:hypothetical protein